jgi:hypothetical protein
MKPAEIRMLTGPLPPGLHPAHRFLMRWIAWEATRFRTLVAVAHARGWDAKDAEALLSASHVGSMDVFRERLTKLAGEELSKNALVPEAWDAVHLMQPVRNKLIHGAQTFAPAVLHEMTGFVEVVLTRPEVWLRPLPLVNHRGQETTVADPLGKLSRTAQPPRHAIELFPLLKVRGNGRGSTAVPQPREIMQAIEQAKLALNL